MASTGHVPVQASILEKTPIYACDTDMLNALARPADRLLLRSGVLPAGYTDNNNLLWPWKACCRD